MKKDNIHETTRRDFLKTASALAVSTAITAPYILKGANEGEVLKVGLIGCGGRGTGAAKQALKADKAIVLTAIGDVFEEQIKRSLETLKNDKEVGEKVKATPETCFVGLDAYKKVIESGVDVVILAEPPGFRPMHLRAAVEAGKHVFCEKPMATDSPGVRSVMESAEIARQKKLALVAGFCWRYNLSRREFYKRIHEGAIGEVRAVYATYLTGPVKPMPPADKRPKEMGDLEWQLRNWYNFVWLSGDGLVEQACHSVDKIAWAMKDVPPIKAVANGGRNIPNNEGNIYDHIDVFYEYESGARAFMAQRQISNCYSDNSDYLMGADGFGTIKGWSAPVIKGKVQWRYQGQAPDMYQQEHDELFASIRNGNPINDGKWMATSTLMAIMGRMAAYTGQEITWEQALNSQEKLVPDNITWDMKLPIQPIATPGKTKFI
ncbi:MAG: Gfo/Idh/MocA family oxidoreductase [Verrucomicrobiae bacterium]|nr:Gfo/Idh/MocA family oxidoreductase [Verrucomicrobiae bacterium]